MQFDWQARIMKNTDTEEYFLDDGSLVVYKRSTEFTHVFNEIAAFLWKECHSKCFNETIDILISNLDDSGDDNGLLRREEIIKDCEELFLDMKEKGLVTF